MLTYGARGHAYKANPPQESQVEWKLEDNLGTQPSIHSCQNLNQARLLLGDLVSQYKDATLD